MYSAAHFKLQGLDPDASYALTNVDVPGTTVVTGRELADVGLRVAIEQQPGAVVILYKKAAP
jgi:hypothetical protein